MTDKQAENSARLISEPPILWDRVEELPPSLRESGPTHALVNQQQSDTGAADDEREAPVLSDEYDLSLVDEERELRRQARR